MYAARDAGAPQAEVRELTVRTKFARMRAERGHALAGKTTYPLLVHGLRLGAVALVGVPVELFSEIGTWIREASPFDTTLVSGYWNGYRNYLPTDAERPRGGYEIDISPFQPGSDRIVAGAAGRVLEALH